MRAVQVWQIIKHNYRLFRISQSLWMPNVCRGNECKLLKPSWISSSVKCFEERKCSLNFYSKLGYVIYLSSCVHFSNKLQSLPPACLLQSYSVSLKITGTFKNWGSQTFSQKSNHQHYFKKVINVKAFALYFFLS